MTQSILNILNPVRCYTVSDWKELAKAVQFTEDFHKNWTHSDTLRRTVELMHRYEELTLQPLKKSHFVCEVKKPILSVGGIGFAAMIDKLTGNDYSKSMSRYQQALSEVIFENTDESQIIFNSVMKILDKPTVMDYVIEVERWNRVSPSPVKINFTEQFVNKLIQ